MADKKIKIEFHNISEDMKLKAVEFVQMWVTNHSKVKDLQDTLLAKELKRNFDENFHPTW